MFIASGPKPDRREPHRGGMVAQGGPYIALRSWALADACRNWNSQKGHLHKFLYKTRTASTRRVQGTTPARTRRSKSLPGRLLWSAGSLRQATGPADYTCPPRAPKPTSGLVEQQPWFSHTFATPLQSG